ncbi:hypothetical protein [Serinicoccus profundi]|uniref:hypothetical protein n=1 Tax=Serinicoccus profundi TaxID=1078471 RepID=UPI001315968D|nr:hypothetical protein [Serinicoccus profundi]
MAESSLCVVIGCAGDVSGARSTSLHAPTASAPAATTAAAMPRRDEPMRRDAAMPQVRAGIPRCWW